MTSRLFFLVVAASLCAADAKYVTGSFHLDAGDFDHGPEYEIAKFSFAEGKSVLRGDFRYMTKDANWRTSPALFLFNDKKFDAYHTAPACDDKVDLAHTVIPIANRHARGGRFLGHGAEAKEAQGVLKKSEMSTEGNHTVWTFEWELDQSERTHGWFIIAADCALEQFNAKVAPMTYHMTILNPGNDHLTADEHGLMTVYSLLVLAMTVFGMYCITMARAYTKKTGAKLHLVIRLLGAAYAMQYVSYIAETIHLLDYASDGVGNWFLDLLSELLEAFASLVISFVLICLACGWTLVESEADKRKGNSLATMLRNPKTLLERGNLTGNILAVVIVALVVMVTLITLTNKGQDEDFTKFHDHETSAGRLMVYFRLLLGLLYLFCFFITVRKQRQRTGASANRLLAFLYQLMLLGAIWFISFPVVVWVAELFFHHYMRHRIVSGGVMLTQTFCLALLSSQFLQGSSTYAKLSTVWESGLLPGAGGLLTATKGRANKD